MKNLFKFFTVAFIALTFFSCEKDDETTPTKPQEDTYAMSISWRTSGVESQYAILVGTKPELEKAVETLRNNPKMALKTKRLSDVNPVFALIQGTEPVGPVKPHWGNCDEELQQFLDTLQSLANERCEETMGCFTCPENGTSYLMHAYPSPIECSETVKIMYSRVSLDTDDYDSPEFKELIIRLANKIRP